MGRPKGGKNKHWSAKEKFDAIKPIIEFKKSSSQVAKETGINSGMLCFWIKKYNAEGIKGLGNKRKPGNPLSKYMKKNNLTDYEKLEYENKVIIENELLKKGYLMKGVGSIVKFMN